jgi:hypothetical protein
MPKFAITHILWQARNVNLITICNRSYTGYLIRLCFLTCASKSRTSVVVESREGDDEEKPRLTGSAQRIHHEHCSLGDNEA